METNPKKTQRKDQWAIAVLERALRGSSTLTLKDKSTLTKEEIMWWLAKEGFPTLRHVDASGQHAIHRACTRAKLGVIHWLLTKGHVSVDVRTSGTGFTPLHIAAIRNHERTATWLIYQAKAHVNAESTEFTTAAMCAAHAGNVSLLKLLLTHGATLTSKGKPLVAVAAIKGHLKCLKWLAEQGRALEELTPSGTSALMHAAANGHKKVVEWLFKKGCDISRVNQQGETALSVAAEKGKVKIVKWLLKRGFTGANAASPLALAAGNGHLAVMDLLVSAKPPVEGDTESSAAMISASKRGHPAVLRWLFSRGVDPTFRDSYGRTPLDWAAERGHLEAVKYFVEEAQQAIDQRSPKGKTIAMHAASSARLDVLRYIYATAPELLKAVDNSGFSALAYAIEGLHLTILQWLIAHGCQVGKEGPQLVSMATRAGSLPILECLFECGAPINSVDSSGFTPVLLAARTGRFPVLKWLYAHGASLTSRTRYGSTLLMVAAVNDHLPMVKWILKKGGNVSSTNHNGNTVFDLVRPYATAVEAFLTLRFGTLAKS